MFTGVTRRYTAVFQVLLTLIALVFALPLAVMLRVSLQGQGLGNYVAVLQHPMIPRFFLNSVIVTACTIALVYVVTLLAAYAFSTRRSRSSRSNALVSVVVPPRSEGGGGNPVNL